MDRLDRLQEHIRRLWWKRLGERREKRWIGGSGENKLRNKLLSTLDRIRWKNLYFSALAFPFYRSIRLSKVQSTITCIRVLIVDISDAMFMQYKYMHTVSLSVRCCRSIFLSYTGYEMICPPRFSSHVLSE